MAQMKELVTTYHLEIGAQEDLVPVGTSRTRYQLVRAKVPLPELNRFLYASVGADWRWYMRIGWSYAQWQSFLNRSEVGTWIAYVEGTPAISSWNDNHRNPSKSLTSDCCHRSSAGA